MSKLSHSNEETMHVIDFRKWADDNGFGAPTHEGQDAGRFYDGRLQAAFLAGVGTSADNLRAYELLFKENGKLHELIRLIFESTVPYNEKGECVFSDRVIELWKTLTPNDRVEGRDAALSRRVPSHDGLCGNGTKVGAGDTADKGI